MNAAKIYIAANGVFYSVYGLWGALMPMGMAGIMGWTPDLLGLHQIRAVSMTMAVLGLYALGGALKNFHPKLLILMIIGVTLAFAAGRLLGLVFDGTGPTQTYAEIAFEVFWSAIGYLIYRRLGAR